MSKATKILNKYELESIIKNLKTDFNNFYKNELVKLLERARELLNQDNGISAEEMFEEANFKIYEETDNYITYRKYPNTIVDDDTYQEIFFNKIDKFVVIAEYHQGRQDEKFITLKEIQAINKQIEEFGW